VIFPDDFQPATVEKLLRRLSNRAPSPFQVIVTREPLRFLVPKDGVRGSINRCVLPRPAFSWLILDAIRGHLEGVP
jgi:hypothetical protein